jgi:hypothetical protein
LDALDKTFMTSNLFNYTGADAATIYCDMDQCLVNFLGGARKVFGMEFNDPRLGSDDRAKWVSLTDNTSFWLELELMPSARLLWDRIKDKNTYILSAVPDADVAPYAPSGKKQWCVRELGISPDRVITCSREQKKNFSRHGGHPNLLIDDHYGNCMAWISCDGNAIWHHTVPETITQLAQFGL